MIIEITGDASTFEDHPEIGKEEEIVQKISGPKMAAVNFHKYLFLKRGFFESCEKADGNL